MKELTNESTYKKLKTYCTYHIRCDWMWTKDRLIERMDEWMNERMSEWMNEWVNEWEQWISESMNHWIRGLINEMRLKKNYQQKKICKTQWKICRK